MRYSGPVLTCLLVSVLHLVTPANAHAAAQPRIEAVDPSVVEIEARHARNGGRFLVGMGLAVQAAGITISALRLAGAGGDMTWHIPFHLCSIPFAPLTAAGFQAALDDGTSAGRLRATGIGLVEGAVYSTVVAVLSGFMGFGVSDIPGGLVVAAFTVPHAAVALGMLIPGVISLAVADHQRRDAATAKVQISPTVGWGTVGIAGRF